MAHYRKKPVVIEAMQFKHGMTEEDWEALSDFMGGFDDDPSGWQWIDIETLEGHMRAVVGDWIIRGVKGEFYPVRDDIFRETYELVSPQPQSNEG